MIDDVPGRVSTVYPSQPRCTRRPPRVTCEQARRGIPPWLPGLRELLYPISSACAAANRNRARKWRHVQSQERRAQVGIS